MEEARKNKNQKARWKDLKGLRKGELIKAMEQHCLLETVERSEYDGWTKAELIRHLEDEILRIDYWLENKAAATGETRLQDDISEHLGMEPMRSRSTGDLTHGLDVNSPSRWSPVEDGLAHSECSECHEQTPVVTMQDGQCSYCANEGRIQYLAAEINYALYR